MANSPSYPADLAELVLATLGASSVTGLRKKALTNLMEIAYFASLKTEEGQQTSCTIACVDPDNSDPSPPTIIRPQRWTAVPFSDRMPFTVANVAKLAGVGHPRAFALAVYPAADGEWFIWGLIDQAFNWKEFMEHEGEGGFAPLGDFMVQIDGPGKLSVFREISLVASLRHDTLVDQFSNVFEKGPVHTLLRHYVAEHVGRVEKIVGTKLPNTSKKKSGWIWNPEEAAEYEWISTLQRILLQAQSHRHGSAFVIASKDLSKAVNMKHRIRYERLPRLLERMMVSNYKAFINYKRYDKLKKDDNVPRVLYRENVTNESQKRDVVEALAGCVRAVAAMSRVDGLVVFDSSLNVLGFGAEIIADEIPQNVCRAGDEEASENFLTPVAYDHFGTRHRSMFRLCQAAPRRLAS